MGQVLECSPLSWSRHAVHTPFRQLIPQPLAEEFQRGRLPRFAFSLALCLSLRVLQFLQLPFLLEVLVLEDFDVFLGFLCYLPLPLVLLF